MRQNNVFLTQNGNKIKLKDFFIEFPSLFEVTFYKKKNEFSVRIIKNIDWNNFEKDVQNVILMDNQSHFRNHEEIEISQRITDEIRVTIEKRFGCQNDENYEDVKTNEKENFVIVSEEKQKEEEKMNNLINNLKDELSSIPNVGGAEQIQLILFQQYEEQQKLLFVIIYYFYLLFLYY